MEKFGDNLEKSEVRKENKEDERENRRRIKRRK